MARLEDFGALDFDKRLGSRRGESDGLAKGVEYIHGASRARGRLVAELVHPLTATVEASFTEGTMTGYPALTRNFHGSGSAWYLTTFPDDAGLQAIVDAGLAAAGVRSPVPDLPPSVEIAIRGDILIVINHGESPADVQIHGTDLETGSALNSTTTLAAEQARFVLRAPTEEL